MSTPLFSAVNEYIKKGASRFHMPGHKGALPGFEETARWDVTEVPGCDELYRPHGAIAELEERYARLYKSGASLLSAGGSTLCIQTMLALAAKPGDKLLIARGCHAAAVNAMALLDLRPVWLFPDCDERTGLAKPVTANAVRRALLDDPCISAVYVTSSDYYGVFCDLSAIGGVCREFHVPLLVDNAHGAHLKFLSPSLHPMDFGADLCSDSLHKTLPVLTGGAMLHMKDPRRAKDAKRYMSLFGSTSPSYPIMLSADLALESLEGPFSKRLQKTAAMLEELKSLALGKGFAVPGDPRDPLKLTLGFRAAGYDRPGFESEIREAGIEPEMTDEAFCVLMASPYNSGSDFSRLKNFINGVRPGPALFTPSPPFSAPRQAKSPREAVFAEWIEVPLDQAVGKTASSFISPCPPGIPRVIPGEVIDENLKLLLKRYGISHLNVIK